MQINVAGHGTDNDEPNELCKFEEREHQLQRQLFLLLPPGLAKFGAVKSFTVWVFLSFFNQVVHSPFCALMYGCQCRWLWSGGWADCNVHRSPDSGEPRCPWCFLWIDHRAQRWYRLFDTAPDQDGLPVLFMTSTALFLLTNSDSPCMSMCGCAAHSTLRNFWLAVNVVVWVACAYVLTASCVGFVWGTVRAYPYFFGGDQSVFANTHNGYVLTVASLSTTFAKGIWGGVFWSAVDFIFISLTVVLFCGLSRAISHHCSLCFNRGT